MSLLRFQLHHLRNIAAADLEFGPSCNFLLGPNASGKTSVLEGISLLATGRSFRTRQFSSVVSHGFSATIAHGRVQQPDGQILEYGVERAKNGQRFRISNERVNSLAELAALLPFQVITPEVSELLLGGPKNRRRFLDWGLFHVEPSFHAHWVRYRKLLRQRNAALRSGQFDQRLLRSWENDFAHSACALTTAYQHYVEQLRGALADFSGNAWPEWADVALEFDPAWDDDSAPDVEDFIRQLRTQEARDRQRGFTGLGPHEAEIRIRFTGYLARDVLSRGQIKLLSILLMLIQAQQLGTERGGRVLLLLDDLAAELDLENRSRVLAEVQRGALQAVITGTQQAALDVDHGFDCQKFHVEHGRVRPQA
jgi:DNA replication and repair protein RecF